MPAAHLFDISGVDLSAVAIAPDRVGELNPQSGDMRQLDHVIWHDKALAHAVGVKAASPDEFWVSGHIPGRPLFPGVLMIEAGAQLASIIFRLRSQEERFLAFTRCDEVVFRHQVVPGDTLLLLMKEVQFKPRRFICRTQGLVHDQIAFEATITGMVVADA